MTMPSDIAPQSQEGAPEKTAIKQVNFWNLLKSGTWVKSPTFWAKFAGYAIPFGFLLYVLYLNFLPFGYHETFRLDIGSANDTQPSNLYILPSKDLSDRGVNSDGQSFRTLNGVATVIFKPSVVLKTANIHAEIKGDGISLIPPKLNFDPSSENWDFDWNFSKEVPNDLKNEGVYYFDGATYFDGASRMEYASSSEMFEDGPFSVYVEWSPTNQDDNFQEIIGHFNWELLQNKDSVQFQVGRMNSTTGTTYSLKYPITQDFFNTRHSALAIYSPSDNGKIILFIDGRFAGSQLIGKDTIWKDYGTYNLSLGWTPHNYNKSPYFKGSIISARFVSKNILDNQTKIDFTLDQQNQADIILSSDATTTLTQLNLNVDEK